MKGLTRWFLVGVLLLNLSAAAAVIVGWLPSTFASTLDPAAADGKVEPDRDALQLLGRQMAQRLEELQRREAELDELYRSKEVQRRVQLLAEAQAAEEPQPQTEQAEGEDAEAAAFALLSRAYENMDPESAASALTKLAGLDQDAVVQLLGTWKPRTSGAILDALAQSSPEIAAELTYEIWKRGGKIVPPPADTDR